MNTATAVAWQEVERSDKIQTAFNRFIDHAVLRLALAGFEGPSALEAIFTTADFLTEEGTLPPFPDDTVTYVECGGWLVAAADMDFIAFLAEAVEG